MKLKRMTLATAWLLLASCYGGTAPQPIEDDGRVSRTALESHELRLVASLPLGTGPGEVTFRHAVPEVAAGGPSAMAVGPDSTIHVADMLAGRVVRVHPVEGARPPLSVPGVEDVLVGEDGTVYAFSRMASRVVIFDESGRERDVVEIPQTMRWVVGLCPWPGRTGDAVGLHTAYQESVALFAVDLHRGLIPGVPGGDGLRYRTLRRDGRARIEVLERRLPRVAPQSLEGLETAESTRSAPLLDAVVNRGTEAPVVATIEAPVATSVGSLEYVGADEAGRIVVDVQDVVGDRPIRVSRHLRRYSREGDLIGEVPLTRGIYTPFHELELAADGTVYLMKPTDSALEIWAWTGGAR